MQSEELPLLVGGNAANGLDGVHVHFDSYRPANTPHRSTSNEQKRGRCGFGREAKGAVDYESQLGERASRNRPAVTIRAQLTTPGNDFFMAG